MYQPSQLHAYLQSLGIKPKKSLSQNFLIDGNVVRKLVATSEVDETATALEIGPGPGALTEALLDTGARVVAVEKDRVLAQALAERLSSHKLLKVICDDIMDVDLDSELKAYAPIDVVANLPYQLTTPILNHVIKKQHLFKSVTVMVQKEVAERMTAKPGTPEYGSLTVFLAFYCDVNYAFTVKPGCFLPPPKIDSAVVHMKLRPTPAVEDHDAFFTFMRAAFSQRRKMLRGSLRKHYAADVLQEAAEKAGIDLTARAGALSLDDFVRFHNALL